MDLSQTNDTLRQKIADLAAQCGESRQVAKRLEDLLPQRLKELERRHRQRCGAGRAQRMALADSAYEEFIRQVCEISATALANRIQWDAHCRLMAARQTLRGFHKHGQRTPVKAGASPLPSKA